MITIPWNHILQMRSLMVGKGGKQSRALAEGNFSSISNYVLSTFFGSGFWVKHPSILRKKLTWYIRNVLEMAMIKSPHISTHSPCLRSGQGEHIHSSWLNFPGHCWLITAICLIKGKTNSILFWDFELRDIKSIREWWALKVSDHFAEVVLPFGAALQSHAQADKWTEEEPGRRQNTAVTQTPVGGADTGPSLRERQTGCPLISSSSRLSSRPRAPHHRFFLAEFCKSPLNPITKPPCTNLRIVLILGIKSVLRQGIFISAEKKNRAFSSRMA